MSLKYETTGQSHLLAWASVSSVYQSIVGCQPSLVGEPMENLNYCLDAIGEQMKRNIMKPSMIVELFTYEHLEYSGTFMVHFAPEREAWTSDMDQNQPSYCGSLEACMALSLLIFQKHQEYFSSPLSLSEGSEWPYSFLYVLCWFQPFFLLYPTQFLLG